MGKGNTQAQIQAREKATQLLNIQETMKGVVQTLERLERVEEGVHRPGALKHQVVADQNHQDTFTNLQALNARLGCLQGILFSYKSDSYRNQCVGHLSQWYQKRQGQYSPVLTQAALDSVSACVGEYQMKTTDVRLNERELAHCATRLYEACSRYHEKADKVDADPEGYIKKNHAMKVYVDGRMQQTDVRDLLEAIRRDIPPVRHSMTPSVEERVEIETPSISSGVAGNEVLEETKGENNKPVEGSTSKPAEKQTSKPLASSKPGDNKKTGNQSNKSTGGSKKPKVSSEGNQAKVDTEVPQNSKSSGQPDTVHIEPQDSVASNQHGCSEQRPPLEQTSKLCNCFISFLQRITAKKKINLMEQARVEVEKVRSYAQTNPSEREVCVYRLYSWYKKAEAPIPRNSLLVVTSGVVACFDQSNVTFGRDNLLSRLLQFHSNAEVAGPLKDIIQHFITELEGALYETHR